MCNHCSASHHNIALIPHECGGWSFWLLEQGDSDNKIHPTQKDARAAAHKLYLSYCMERELDELANGATDAPEELKECARFVLDTMSKYL